MGEVIPLGGITRIDLPTNQVLDAVKGHCTDGVVVLGFDDDGDFYFASSIADGGSIIWLMELAKKHLLDVEVD